MKPDKKLFSNFIGKYGNKRLVLMPHTEADLDAVAACYALSFALPKSDIILPDNSDDEAALLMDKLGIGKKFIRDADRRKYDGVVVVDTAVSRRVKGVACAGMTDGLKVLCIIDHHRKIGKDLKAPYEFIDEECPSTCEIIANMLPERVIKSKSNNKIPFALSIGIIADTAQFNSARAETFETLGRLMKISGAGYGELLFYAEPPKSPDKKIAIAKAVGGMQFCEYKGMIIATCKSGSNESDAATMLASKLDVAFVAKKDSRNKGFVRISGRVNKNTEVRLNEVMMKVGAYFGGNGGGHHKAAGANVKAKPDEALAKCVEVLKEWVDRNRS